MAYLSVTMDAPGADDVSRLYFGTDSHAMGMLLGAAFAAVWRMDRLPAARRCRRRARPDGGGRAGLVGDRAGSCTR